MEVDKIIIQALAYLDEPLTIYTDPETRDQQTVTKLLGCVDAVVTEIADEYMAIKTKESVTFVNGKMLFSTLSHTLLVPEKLVNEKGEEVKFVELYDGLESKISSGVLTYRCVPECAVEHGEIALPAALSLRTVALGVASVFASLCEKFEKASSFSERYYSALRSVVLPKREVVVRKRRWL